MKSTTRDALLIVGGMVTLSFSVATLLQYCGCLPENEESAIHKEYHMEVTGREIRKRAPTFFNELRLKQFLHCFDKLEYVFPDVDWQEFNVEDLRDECAAALQILNEELEGDTE